MAARTAAVLAALVAAAVAPAAGAQDAAATTAAQAAQLQAAALPSMEPVRPPAQVGPVTRDPVVEAAPAPAARDLSSCYPAREPGHVACFERPSLFGFLLDVPRDIGAIAVDAVRPSNLPWMGAVAISTGGLLAADQDLSNGAHRLGRWAGISSTGKTAALRYVPIPYPTDVGSGMYYIGDGMVPVMLTVGWFGYGLATGDNRALGTTAHLAEGLIAVGIVTQTLKHITGRQSPSRATEDGGRWRPLPNPLTYHEDVPGYDAFPSGHMATAMVTVTILAEDYPEYRYWVYGIGYGLMGALGFQMMNNDVHWASDYPLALAIGYGIGKHATSRRREILDLSGSAPRKPAVTLDVVPFSLQRGGGLALTGTF